MSWLNLSAILLTAYLAVFLQSWVEWPRHLLGAQIDVLPALMVYVGLSAGIGTSALVAAVGGLLFDSLSANQLGVSIIPLFVVGLAVYTFRDLILREQTYAQFCLGAGACALAPAGTLLFIFLGMDESAAGPLLGWQSAWQWVVMAIGGGAFTPLFFGFFDRINRTFNYQPLGESTFRPDREIKRGRH